jgi:glycosyltransferase involved in cell wall biosynthesis
LNILFLTDNFPPEVNAPATRTFEHCKEWVEQGAKVTVITGFPNFPQGKVYEGYRNKWRQEENIEGIRVIRVWTYISANSGFLKRTLDYVSFGVMAVIHSLGIKTDLIIATSPQFFTALGGYFSAILKRKPWVMEVRDLWPESIKAVGAMEEDSRLLHWLERLELHLYKRAKKIIVVTDAFKENIANRGINPTKIAVVKNGVHVDQFKPIPKDQALASELSLQNKFVVAYIGTHGMAHKLDFILRAAARVEDPNIHFLFLGDGAEKQRLLVLKKELGLDNVTMLPFVPKSEVKRYISLSDVALVPLKKSDTCKTVLPSKIFENAAMQKPILLGVEGESKAIIEKYDAGLCFEPENEADFFQHLSRLAQDSALYREKQEGCKRLAQDFDRAYLAREMYSLIETVVR